MSRAAAYQAACRRLRDRKFGGATRRGERGRGELGRPITSVAGDGASAHDLERAAVGHERPGHLVEVYQSLPNTSLALGSYSTASALDLVARRLRGSTVADVDRRRQVGAEYDPARDRPRLALRRTRAHRAGGHGGSAVDTVE